MSLIRTIISHSDFFLTSFSYLRIIQVSLICSEEGKQETESKQNTGKTLNKPEQLKSRDLR